MPPKLRVGIMLDGTVVPSWIHSIFAEINASEHAELALAIFNNAPKTKRTLRQKLGKLREYAFGMFYLIDAKLFSRNVALDAFAPADVSALFEGVPQLKVIPLQGKFVDRFSEDDLDVICAAQLDVMLRFGFRIIKGDILNTTKYGVWSYHHGDNDFYRGGPALFWEMYENNAVSGTILQILNEELDGGTVIYKSYSATDRFALYRNRNATYWKTARFVVRKLHDLADNGTDALNAIPPACDARPKMYRVPSMPRLALFGLRCAARLAAAKVRFRLVDDQWFVAIAKRTPSDSGASSVPAHGPFEALAMPRSRYYADPCAISVKAQDFIFFEDYSFREKKGRISCATIDASGQIANISVVLEEPFHLSYPFVFELDGDYFMIPESAAASSVRLYRATEFPTRWQFETTLLSPIQAVDATLHRTGDGMFWLFANIAPPGAFNLDELHLFHATSLHGPWKPHRQNPIVSDVRRARPAGRLFRRNGMLIRPSQNSSVRYGGSIVLNVVDELNPMKYRETKLEEIGPEWLENSVATHTLSITDRLVVTDGLRPRLKSRRA